MTLLECAIYYNNLTKKLLPLIDPVQSQYLQGAIDATTVVLSAWCESLSLTIVYSEPFISALKSDSDNFIVDF